MITEKVQVYLRNDFNKINESFVLLGVGIPFLVETDFFIEASFRKISFEKEGVSKEILYLDQFKYIENSGI